MKANYFSGFIPGPCDYRVAMTTSPIGLAGSRLAHTLRCAALRCADGKAALPANRFMPFFTRQTRAVRR
jgi:hypothetical protein